MRILEHWGLAKIVKILQTTFLNAFFNENFWTCTQISLKYILYSSVDYRSALVMALCTSIKTHTNSLKKMFLKYLLNGYHFAWASVSAMMKIAHVNLSICASLGNSLIENRLCCPGDQLWNYYHGAITDAWAWVGCIIFGAIPSVQVTTFAFECRAPLDFVSGYPIFKWDWLKNMTGYHDSSPTWHTLCESIVINSLAPGKFELGM